MSICQSTRQNDIKWIEAKATKLESTRFVYFNTHENLLGENNCDVGIIMDND